MRRFTVLTIFITAALALAACGSSGSKSSTPLPSPAVTTTAAASTSASASASGPTGPDLARWLLNETEGPPNWQVGRQNGPGSPATLASGDPGCDVINKDTFSSSAASVGIGYDSASDPDYVFTALDFPKSPSPKEIKGALATCHHFNAGDDVDAKLVAAPAITGVDPTNIVAVRFTGTTAGSIHDSSVLVEAETDGIAYTAIAGVHSDGNSLPAAAVNRDYLPEALVVLQTQMAKVKADGKGTYPIKVS
jgi:hypothetical protein